MVSFRILGCLFAAGAATAAGARAQLGPYANRLIAWSHAASAAGRCSTSG